MGHESNEPVGPPETQHQDRGVAPRCPFRITGHTWEKVEALVVTLEHKGRTGRGEAAGVYYKADTPASMVEQLLSLRTSIEAGVTHTTLRRLLPPGGAQNALDCALLGSRGQDHRSAAWEIAGLQQKPKPLVTNFTCGAESPETR